MKNNTTDFTVDKENLTISLTRVFDAPRVMLWAAATDPAMLALWWGPARFETVVEKFDLRPGGEWRMVHRDPSGAAGTEFGFHGVTKEVQPLEKIVQTFNFEGIPPGHEMLQTMVLEDADGGKRTKLTVTAKYQNIQDLEGMVQSGMESGERESFDRLAELTRSKRELTIVRVFDAPRDLVWKAWTDPKLFAEWWGPTAFTNPRCELDVRPGGAIRVDMTAPDGTVAPMDGTFEEVKAPERLVFVSRALDDKENVLLENRNTVTFEEQGGKTKVTLEVKVLSATPAMDAALSGMEMGWRQSFDKLAALTKNSSR